MRRIVLTFFASAALASLALTLHAQQPQQMPSTPVPGLLMGRAIDGGTGAPLSGVTVSLSPRQALGVSTPDADVTRVLTDSDGNFVFAGVVAGRYRIQATKSGYVPGTYGKRAPGGGEQPLDLGAGERRGDLAIPLWKFAAVTGRVVDEAGQPLIGVSVNALRRTIVAGHWQLTQAGNGTTDDRGQYRIWSLVPGEYVVGVVATQATVPASVQDAYAGASAAGRCGEFSQSLNSTGRPGFGGVRVGTLLVRAPDALAVAAPGRAPGPPQSDGAVFVFPTTFFSGAAAPSAATPVSLASGQERAGVDFQMQPVRSVRVAGTLMGPGGPVAQIGLQLQPAGTPDAAPDYNYDAATTVSDAAGAFTFLGVTPGEYVIRVLKAPPRPQPEGQATVVQVGSSTIYSFTGPPTPPSIPNEPTLWATQPVSVADSDVTGVIVSLRTGARISGHVEFDGATPPPAAARLRTMSVVIAPADGERAASSAVSQIQQGRIDENGNISSYELPPGRYVVRAFGPPGWAFRGATIGGQDVADTGFEIGSANVSGLVVTFTDRPAELSGMVRSQSRGAGAPGAVLLFPADSRAWIDYGASARRFRSGSAGADGRFTFADVPDGDYLALALDDEPVNWQAPETIRKLAAAATRVTIAPGEKQVQDLTIRQVK